MGAIAGIYRFHSDAFLAEHGERMMGELLRFPYDRAALWQQNNILLGCHAQWITEQSAQEVLPYYDSERRLAITADAIIDNRNELMDDLQVFHHRRESTTDSELLLLAYLKWGTEMPKRLIGDFAFMIWDETKRLLFGARDFSGARTLYYHRDEQQFSFCTVMSPLFALPSIHKSLNDRWMAEFLAIKGVFEPPDLSQTVFKAIEQLPPSHSITIYPDRIRIDRYNPLSDIKLLRLRTEDEYVEAFRDVFLTATTSRTRRTSRQIGAHLSGGLDSGSVASFAARALKEEDRSLYAFSYIPDQDFVDWTPKRRIADETPLIRQTVEYAGNIQANYLHFPGKSPYTEIDEWLDLMEAPYKFFENTFWLRGIYEQARQSGVGILLNGARGNYSISWGSAPDYYARLMKQLKWVRLSREINQYSRNIAVGQKRVYSDVANRAFPGLSRLRKTSSFHYDYPQLIHTDYARMAGIEDRLEDSRFTGIGSTADLSSDPLEARKQHFERVNVWSTTGTTGCKLSLRYSLWSHDPTNDLRVIRFCLAAPMEQFVQHGMDRALIRRATEGWLPDSIRLNQRTRGIQAADSIHRMQKSWTNFINEVEALTRDTRMQQMINMPVVLSALSEARVGLSSDQAYNPTIKLLMRSLIVHRFLQKNF